MAYSVVTESAADAPSSGANIASPSALTTQAGDTIVVFAHVAQANLASQMTCSDGTNTYTRRQADYYASTQGNFAAFVAENAAAGNYTPTVAWDGSTRTNRGIKAVVLRGLKAASFQSAIASNQASPGTGTNAVSSGTMTPTEQPACLIGMAIAAGLQTPTAGTGHTTLTPCWQFGSGTNLARPEHRRLTSTSGTAATWTSTPSNYMHFVIALILSETDAGGGTVYNESISESASASESVTPVMIRLSELVENAEALESKAATTITMGEVEDDAYASEAVSAVGTWLHGLSESSTATESMSATPAYEVAIADAATALEAVAAILGVAGGITEVDEAEDAVAALLGATSSVDEVEAATDSVQSTQIAMASLDTDGDEVTDSIAAALICLATTLEDGAASDEYGAGGSTGASIEEPGSAQETVAAGPVLVSSVSETATAAESVSALVDALMEIAETGSATDSTAATAHRLAEIIDSAAATDAVDAVMHQLALLAEAGFAVDEIESGGSFSVMVIDAANATDVVFVLDSAARALPSRTLIVAPALRELRIVGVGELRRLIVVRP